MTNKTPLDAPGLARGDVSLDPVQPSDEAGLRSAADTEETWKWYPFRGDGEYFNTQLWKWVLDGRVSDSRVPFIVRQAGRIVGSTGFLAIDSHNQRVEIGGTWYSSDVRGSVVNPACKLLLIQRAFDWGAQRVEWKTDSNNIRSRAAIEKLGAQYEGTLRNHMYLHDGRVRHSAYYSMIPKEWPAAKAKLKARLASLT